MRQIVDQDGGFTKAERELLRLESLADSKASGGSTAANTDSNAAGGIGGAPAAPVATDAKEAGRVAAFRLLRAKKVLLALASNGESPDSD
jgi:hypothetical protein